MGQVIKGIDISSHQGDIDFERVKADGVRFVIIKAGQGLRAVSYTHLVLSTRILRYRG